MKKLIYRAMVMQLWLSCSLMFTACDKDEPEDTPVGCAPTFTAAKNVIQSADNKCKVIYTNNGLVSKIIIPAEGGVFSFKLSDNSVGILHSTGEERPLTSYDFTPVYINEVGWRDAPGINDDVYRDPYNIAYVINSLLEVSRDNKKTICTFGYIETSENGFTIKIDPNQKNEDRTICIQTEGRYFYMAEREDWIWQLPKQAE